jgi:hypothetical protein
MRLGDFRRIHVLLLVLGGLAAALPARAADLAVTPPVGLSSGLAPAPYDRFEARFGAFAHGTGSAEQGTISLNAEIVTPRLYGVDGFWAFLVPRVHAGGFVNLSGRTNHAYGGLLWTIPVYKSWFVEGFFGAAIHDGSLAGTDRQAALGCYVLFNAGGSIGYRINQNWSVMGTFNHISNGNQVFDRRCSENEVTALRSRGRNQGLNHWGARISYAF